MAHALGRLSVCGGELGGVCFIPETPVSWIPGTGIRVSKAEKALLSVLPTFVLVHLGKDSPLAFKGNVSKSPLPSCKFSLEA